MKTKILGILIITLLIAAVLLPIGTMSADVECGWERNSGPGYVTLYDNSDRVGIGTDTPSAELEIWGNEEAIANNVVIGITNIDSDGYEGVYFNDGITTNTGITVYNQDHPYSNQMHIFNNRDDGSIRFRTAGVEKMILNNLGYFGIGETNPTAKLHIGGTSGIDGIRFPDGTLQTTAFTGEGGGTGEDNDWTIQGPKMWSTVSGNVGIGTNSPDTKLHIAKDISSELIAPEGQDCAKAAQLCLSGIGDNENNQLRLGFDTINNRGWIMATEKCDNIGRLNKFPLDLNDGVTIDQYGDLGIGTDNPSSQLHIYNDDENNLITGITIEDINPNDLAVTKLSFENDESYAAGSLTVYDSDHPLYPSRFVIKTWMEDGSIHFWTSPPDDPTDERSDVEISNAGNLRVGRGEPSEWTALYLYGDEDWMLNSHNHGDFGIRHNTGTDSNPDWDWAMRIESTDHRVCVPTLQIEGGSDIVEPFTIQKSNIVQPGMIVVIDAENPGNLKIADKAYDRCVAGIISGAGGIKPGLMLNQNEIFVGTHPVALAGRVYGLCDASYGAIQPGDLLTTSPTPGYAMKVTNYGEAQGAIIGKAMTNLDEGQGLVLILVSLQ